MIKFDHIAIGCETLIQGSEYIESETGILVPVGGEHPNMGTHNCVMATGPDSFLEIISINPAAPKPAQPRWFGLDRFTGAPRPLAWVCNSTNLDADLEIASSLGIDLGQPTTQTRGDMTWRFAVRADGTIPLAGVAPMLMQWPEMPAHPASKMTDVGLRVEVSINTPAARQLTELLAALGANVMPVTITEAPETQLNFTLNLPENGQVVL
ncbi:MAG: VOC family protein [Rhodobacteraceae bacterium]|nr:VOC family protein [Paracoccaceae bacterium]